MVRVSSVSKLKLQCWNNSKLSRSILHRKTFPASVLDGVSAAQQEAHKITVRSVKQWKQVDALCTCVDVFCCCILKNVPSCSRELEKQKAVLISMFMWTLCLYFSGEMLPGVLESCCSEVIFQVVITCKKGTGNIAHVHFFFCPSTSATAVRALKDTKENESQPACFIARNKTLYVKRTF